MKARAKSDHELIIAHREVAQRIVRSLMRRWNVRLEQDDVHSIADIALCEAAVRFDPEKNVKFITYLFHFLRGTLIQEIRTRKRQSNVILESTIESRRFDGEDGGARAGGETLSALATEQGMTGDECPERNTYLKELQFYCELAMQSLSPLEREVVTGIHFHEKKVARYAREIGYSRGHLSAVRKQAFTKLRPQLEPLAA